MKINWRTVININKHNQTEEISLENEKIERNKIEESKEKPFGCETILVVDEEERDRRFAVKVLSELGYTVLEAEDDRDALEIIKNYRGKINLLLTNVIMPGIDGIQLSKQIKGFYPEARIIFMSRATEDIMLYHSIPEGGKDGVNFLRKSNASQTLAWKVRSVLDSLKGTNYNEIL